MHWSERLRQKLNEKGWTVVELARRSGIDKERIYKYLKGKTEAPRGDTLARLANALDVTELWLEHGVDLTGPGKSENSHVGLQPISVVSLSDLSDLRRTDDLPKLIGSKQREKMAVPAEAGPRAIVVRLDDDSMAPKFSEGCFVVCDPDAHAVPGKYVIAVSKKLGRAVFRRYRAVSPGNGRGAKAELIAENRDFPPVKLDTKRDGFIIGRAVFLFHKL